MYIPQDAAEAWKDKLENYLNDNSVIPPTEEHPADKMPAVLKRWNERIFNSHGLQLVLCREYFMGLAASPMSAVYLVSSPVDSDVPISQNFDPVPSGLEMIEVFDPKLPNAVALRAGTECQTRERPGRGVALLHMVRKMAYSSK